MSTATLRRITVAAWLIAAVVAGFVYGQAIFKPVTVPGHTLTKITEDSPGWDCATMGNRVCGGTATLTAVMATGALGTTGWSSLDVSDTTDSNGYVTVHYPSAVNVIAASPNYPQQGTHALVGVTCLPTDASASHNVRCRVWQTGSGWTVQPARSTDVTITVVTGPFQ